MDDNRDEDQDQDRESTEGESTEGDWLALPARPTASDESPLIAYRDAQPAAAEGQRCWLDQIMTHLNAPALGVSPSGVPGAIADYLARPKRAEELIAHLDVGERLALGLFALTETCAWPAVGLAHALGCLGLRCARACYGHLLAQPARPLDRTVRRPGLRPRTRTVRRRRLHREPARAPGRGGRRENGASRGRTVPDSGAGPVDPRNGRSGAPLASGGGLAEGR